MLKGSDIPNFDEAVDIEEFYVYTPSSVLFVCGGPQDVTKHKPCSLRDAFMRISADGAFNKYQIILAEELNPFFPRGKYEDYLTLEEHVAQISRLILLFSESYGSAAELGAFAVNEEISKKLLIAIDEKNYAASSFIKLGPIRVLENKVGEESICVLSNAQLNFEDIKNVSNLNIEEFRRVMENAIEHRVEKIKDRKTFDNGIPGHLIKFITGLIQVHGALKKDEIDQMLKRLAIVLSDDDLENYLLCSEFAGWIIRKKRGLHTFFIAAIEKKAISYSFKDGTGGTYHSERKYGYEASIREHWKKTDTDRFSLISEAVKGMVAHG